jgi:hypothetical protein
MRLLEKAYGSFLLARTDIKVHLNWLKLIADRWPVRVVTIRSRAELLGLYTCSYASPDRINLNYDAPNATPMRIADLLHRWRDFPDVTAQGISKERVQDYVDRFSSAAATGRLIGAAYDLKEGRLLLLDGHHRALALASLDLPFRVRLAVISGPLDEAVLPDLRHWMERPKKQPAEPRV